MKIGQVRFDLTGEYRSPAKMKARDHISFPVVAPNGTIDISTDYQGKLESLVGLVNGYVDLFTWNGVTPYVGAGVGFARNTMKDLKFHPSAVFTDAVTGVQTQLFSSSGFSETNTKTEFAWALMAGASFDLSERTKLDIGYRYLNLGSGHSAETELLICSCGSIGSPLKISDIESHEIRIGLRIALTPEPEQHRPLK